MSQRICWFFILSGVLVVGCQSSSDDSNATDAGDTGTQAANDANAVDQLTQATTPEEAVKKFFQALCDGDEITADGMLTKKARDETTKADLAVKPPGSKTAQYVIGEVEYLEGQEGAHVMSRWTDTTPDGFEESYEIVWILRSETGNWRIAGMATKLFEDDPPLILNFEDPTDMIEQRRLAEERIAKRVEEQMRQAQNQPIGEPGQPQR